MYLGHYCGTLILGNYHAHASKFSMTICSPKTCTTLTSTKMPGAQPLGTWTHWVRVGALEFRDPLGVEGL